MRLESSAFLVFITAFVVLYQLIPSQRWKQGILTIASAYFLSTYLIGFDAMGVLLILVLGGYSTAWLGKQTQKLSLPIFVLIILQIIIFVILKRYEIILPLIKGTLLDRTIVIVGYSYILFRQIHVIVDAVQGAIPQISIFPYTVYLLSFLTLLAGPIQRYQAFMEQWQQMGKTPPTIENTIQGLSRVANGYFSFLVLAFLLRSLLQIFQQSSAIGILKFYTDPILLYLNFAGYCSIVIGIGQIIQFQLPENFDRPWLARDPLDFWRRWHITLTDWMRDYFFTPLYKWSIQKNPRWADTSAILISFVTFWVVGLWHGTTLNFITISWILAVAAALTQLYDILLRRWLGRKRYRQVHNNRLVTAISIIITMHYFGLIVVYFE